MAEIYLTCKVCQHTQNVHTEQGCRAYLCSCKEPKA